jgi:phospholipid/cholesterol/gamma-HCH transport system ATP-binding protein
MSYNKKFIVTLRDVQYSRWSKTIFRGVNIDVPRGKITAIMGPSGTGKTTLLRLMGGMIKADKGTVEVNGVNIAELSRNALNTARRQMGMLFQEGALFSDINVFENVSFLLREHTNLPEEMIRDLTLLKLQAVGLRGASSLKINELSGGMSRRVALARAIMLDPELMMYDEPFTGQDPINRGVLIKLIRELNDALGLTSILVSHDVSEVTAIADWLYVIADGTVIAKGTPEDIMNSKDPKIYQFVNGKADGPVPFEYPAVDFKEELDL